ncbi:helix-turn-helix domain-containing protein [Agrobacterium larrymoorei]|uniref:XRE family transcriptional regulator n=1 Tax=Agrobacterium larrymoorei TaxID=160699 RepID=A0AAF0H975_9HYPH|nr:helix-turn-helix domain-containing protein [Agrobacterium larrymoorei]WHA40425.1 XRE family transcriptional regulator [Agrobacterium larrymoorei]
MSDEWKSFKAELPDDVQQRLNAKREERRLGRALADLRKAMNATQQDVAVRANSTQNAISKIENADDVLLSSVVRYMHAIGGGVELVLKTADGKARRVDFDPDISVDSFVPA